MELCIKVLVSSGFLSEFNNLSLLFNTDGVPVFKSSGFSVWPLHLVINELPFGTRYMYAKFCLQLPPLHQCM